MIPAVLDLPVVPAPLEVFPPGVFLPVACPSEVSLSVAYQIAVFPAEACLPWVFLLWNQVISRFHRALICLRRDAVKNALMRRFDLSSPDS